jgi:hypothetical protein
MLDLEPVSPDRLMMPVASSPVLAEGYLGAGEAKQVMLQVGAGPGATS